MSIKDMITDIVYKNTNGIKMNDFEILILDTYVDYVTNHLFNNNKVNIDDLYEHIRNVVKEISIVRLVFSNDSCIYIDKHILLKMQFFQNLLGV